MMKKIGANLSIMMLLSMVTSLWTMVVEAKVVKEDNAVKLCWDSTAEYYAQYGSKSDVPREVRSGFVLPAGEALTDVYGKFIKVFDHDVLVYKGNGSEHSGFFIEVIVVDMETCDVLERHAVYSE